MKRTVQITILGQQYALKSEAEPDEVRKVAAFVNGKIEEMAAGGKAVDTLDAAVLALLNVAGSYLRLLESESPDPAEERLVRLLQRLDAALAVSDLEAGGANKASC
ncbi:cell division protein ZapA [Geoalkalibacter sp.]|uniref:cell division protein ZapA n=1 Tax=Geoalkalibacter sp. TaxID=3041440 RepID=UPI00272DF14C|nr:cell division protein ZapA [Geoalkalibacter sp.]